MNQFVFKVLWLNITKINNDAIRCNFTFYYFFVNYISLLIFMKLFSVIKTAVVFKTDAKFYIYIVL